MRAQPNRIDLDILNNAFKAFGWEQFSIMDQVSLRGKARLVLPNLNGIRFVQRISTALTVGAQHHIALLNYHMTSGNYSFRLAPQDWVNQIAIMPKPLTAPMSALPKYR